MLLTLLLSLQIAISPPQLPVLQTAPASISVAVSYTPPPPAPVVVIPPKPPGPSVQDARTFANDYTYGNCTAYVASRLAIPDNWGNAVDWYSNAQSQGYHTGTTPIVGSVAWFPANRYSSWGHVALVTDIEGGSITISEMNVEGLAVVDTRTIPASEVLYIY